MATFSTNGPVNFNTDFWVLEYLVTGTYENTNITGFKVDDGLLFESSVTVTGAGFTFGAPPNGTINGIEVKNNSGGVIDTYTITGLSLNLITLKDELAFGAPFGMSLIFDGNDTITGSAFDDLLNGYNGIDGIVGGAGNDDIFGGNDGDTINGGENNDDLYGGSGNDTGYGGNGDDFLSGGLHDDYLRGGGDNDVIYGGNNVDQLFGDAGDDSMRGGTQGDTIDGGAGSDTADYADKSTSVAVTLNGANDATVIVGGLAEDTVRNVENVTGGTGNDVLTGDALANVLSGGNGNDILNGNEGGDTLNGGLGADLIYGGIGNDNVDGGGGADVIDGGVGDDTVGGGTNNDLIHGGEGNDTINGGDQDDALHGDFGADFLTGGAGLDSFFFESKPGKVNADHITDFDPALDTLMFDHNVFKKVNDSGEIKGKFFEIGKHADDANDYFVYNATKGVLFYDKDGDGAGKQKAIAFLDNAPDLTKADLFLF